MDSIDTIFKIALQARCENAEDTNSKTQILNELSVFEDLSSSILFGEGAFSETFSSPQNASKACFDLLENKLGKKPKNTAMLMHSIYSEEDKRKLIHELLGLELFHSLDLKSAYYIRAKAIFKLHLKDQVDTFVIAVDKANGIPAEKFLSYYIEDELKNDLTKEKENLVTEFCFKVGLALAELHSHTKLEKKHLEQSIIDTYDFDLQFLTQLLDEVNYSGSLKKADLFRIYNFLLNDLRNEKIPITFHHGNLEGRNIFYDQDNKKITFINFSSSYDSINKEGNPIGFSFKDYTSFDFLLKMLSIFSAKISDSLRQSFKSGYEEGGGLIPSKKSCSLEMFNLFIKQFHACLSFTKNIENSEISISKVNDILQFHTDNILSFEKDLFK